MRKWELLQWVGALVAFAAVGLWIAHGGHVFTKDKQMVVHREQDPIFGTTRERVEWRSTFRLGLDIAAPVAAIGGGLWLLSRWQLRRLRRQTDVSQSK
jgi:hypothetical protein